MTFPYEKYVYDPNKKVSLGEEIAKANETWQKMMKAFNERDFDTANKIAEDNHFNCRFSAKSYNSDKPQKDLSFEPISEFERQVFENSFNPLKPFEPKEPKHVWHDPKTEKPEDGEIILIREYYKSPRYGKFVNNYRVITYFNDFGFKHEEKMNRECYGYRITHWMRIPPVE